jgi:hypothetical protein
MLIALVSSSTVTQVGDYKELFPNTSFPPNGPSNEFLIANSAKKVNLFKSYDSLTQKLESATPTVEGEWVYTVQVANLTAEEVQSAKDSAMAQLKAQRTQLLADTDWTQIPDNPIANKAEWATYRQALRDFPATVLDARVSYQFPHDPNWVEPTNPV